MPLYHSPKPIGQHVCLFIKNNPSTVNRVELYTNECSILIDTEFNLNLNVLFSIHSNIYLIGLCARTVGHKQIYKINRISFLDIVSYVIDITYEFAV